MFALKHERMITLMKKEKGMNNKQVKPQGEKIDWWEIWTTMVQEWQEKSYLRAMQQQEKDRIAQEADRLAREEARVDRLLNSIDRIAHWLPRKW